MAAGLTPISVVAPALHGQSGMVALAQADAARMVWTMGAAPKLRQPDAPQHPDILPMPG